MNKCHGRRVMSGLLALPGRCHCCGRRRPVAVVALLLLLCRPLSFRPGRCPFVSGCLDAFLLLSLPSLVAGTLLTFSFPVRLVA